MTDYSEYRLTTGLPDYDFSNEAYRAGWEDGHKMVAYPVRDSQYRGTEDFDAYRAGYNKGQMEFTGFRRHASQDDWWAYLPEDCVGGNDCNRKGYVCASCEAEARRREQRASSRRTAHDTGARTTIQHCAFCGSGSVYARSDGAAQCDFCDSVFTVQLQPTHSGTPQTIGGEPYDPFEEGAIEGEQPALDSGGGVPREEVVARQRRLRAAWEESQNPPRGGSRRRAGRVNR